ncbi:MAG: M3 family metallopeptidase [Saprospiraceae bacterium]|nr:M3 family metallopeptidase [Saprospiraceae bacterium]
MNPFLSPYDTAYGVPPFDIIKTHHFKTGVKLGLEEQKMEITAITGNTELPDFNNTILALEQSGQTLKRTTSVMYNLSYSNTSPELQVIMQKLGPTLSAHSDSIIMNPKLFSKIKYLWDNRYQLKIKGEKRRLLETYYKNFVRNGANLTTADKKRVSLINQRLTVLSLQFSKNILDIINDFRLIITDPKDLSGLPEEIIATAAETALTAGLKNTWVFTLQNASVIPFLQYADSRVHRHSIWSAYVNKGNNGDTFDNNEIVKEMVRLRAEKARLLGYNSHAHYVLENQMAKTPDQVMQLLNNLWSPALEMAKSEAEALQTMIHKDGHDFKLEAWDWRYYAERLRKEKYDLDENDIKPYFSLQNALKGVFNVAEKLYSIQFVKKTSLPVYHRDVEVYKVQQSDRKIIGILYLDFFPRDSKQGGAWMTSFVEQYKIRNKRIVPVISIVCNFTKPLGDIPSLLTFDEVNTLFHEFGHALHGLLSNVSFSSLAGTNVPTDFVELPSQIMENWSSEPEILKNYAFHYITGKVLPNHLIQKMESSSKYGQGFATVEYLAASILDMSFHTMADGVIDDVKQFENDVLQKIGLLPQIISRYRSTYFSHIFAGGYSSGYYSYIWSEVLDADAYSVFKTKGLFDQQTAHSFCQNILKKGGSADPMKLYVKFRGKKPDTEAMLEKRGLVLQKVD